MMLQVLLEDNHCLAVAKPAPLLTQAPPGVPSLEALAKAYLKERYGKAGNVYLGVPHRLDRPVSGVVLFARSSKAARRLAEQFQERHVAKIYWAAVEGDVQPAEGTWEDWLRKVEGEPRAEKVDAGAAGAQHAVSHYRRVAAWPRGAGIPACQSEAGTNACPTACGTLIEVRPETGRMHQIRLQAALRGHPVRGDWHYGAALPFGPTTDVPRDRIIALHARALTFLHPIRYEPITVTAPLPEAWGEVIPLAG